MQFVGDFQPEKILVNLNVKDEDDGAGEYKSYESFEYGGFLLMMDTVPEKSPYDLRRELHARRFDLHSTNHLAQQAVVRPKQMDRRLDGRAPRWNATKISQARRSAFWEPLS